jgi:hypothetical protein
LQSEGKLDKAKGAAHEAVGDLKDAVRKAPQHCEKIFAHIFVEGAAFLGRLFL